LYSVYGPYEEPTRLIPALIACGSRGDLPPLVNPEVARDYVYVDDVSEACVLAAASPTGERGAVFNVGTGVQTSLSEVVEIARGVMGVSKEPSWGSMPNRQWDTDVWVADKTKIERELGWQSRFTFEDGFRETVKWFRRHPEMLKFYEEKATIPANAART
jgi:UDP-glucose 4-epimerase